MSRRRKMPRPTASTAGVLAAAVAVAVFSGWVLMRDQTTPVSQATDTSAPASPIESRSSLEPTAEQSAPIDAAMAALADDSDPAVILVLGDSTTSASEENWLNLTADELGKVYDRPVILHPWQQAEDPKYVNDYLYNTEQDGEPIEVWSAGASGRDAQYTLEMLDEMAPMPAGSVDWVIIDHGHNHAPDDLVNRAEGLVDVVIGRFPQAPVTIIGQNPQASPRTSDERAAHEDNVNALELFAPTRGATWIDIFSVIKGADSSVDDLTDGTGVHPTAEGYALWSREVTEWIAAKSKDLR